MSDQGDSRCILADLCFIGNFLFHLKSDGRPQPIRRRFDVYGIPPVSAGSRPHVRIFAGYRTFRRRCPFRRDHLTAGFIFRKLLMIRKLLVLL
jgi:hypothetical protein